MHRLLWFLRDYPLAALLLRAATLAFDALLLGGILFCAVLLPRSLAHSTNQFSQRALRLLRMAAWGLATTQFCFVGLDSAVLMSTGGLGLADLCSANYFLAGALTIAATGLFLLLSRRGLPGQLPWLLFILPLLFATVWTSHSASRLEHRASLMLLSALHQLAAAVWIGGMPFLWLLLGSPGKAGNGPVLRAARRYSVAAVASVAVLVLAGASMGWFYTQSWSAVYGTGYGLLLVTKSVLLAALLLLGAGNFLLIRKQNLHLWPPLLRIARLSEVEIGIGFTVILAAASLSAQPPAVDMVQNRLTLPEIAARMRPKPPRLQTPPVAELPAVQPFRQAIEQYAISPDDPRSANNRAEQAWSEYNHHWAGMVVLAAGLLALLGGWGGGRWPRHWPLMFLALGVFLLLRADPEAWPLGPRGFWASLYNPEDLEHRLYVLLILGFAFFEWGVQTGRLASRRAALAFPIACAAGGALLLTHTHSLGNVKEELLAGMSHSAIAVCAVFAGWSRWLEVRAPLHGQTRIRRAAAWTWPVCLVLIGLILLNYREA